MEDPSPAGRSRWRRVVTERDTPVALRAADLHADGEDLLADGGRTDLAVRMRSESPARAGERTHVPIIETNYASSTRGLGEAGP
jgi:hypothetical protein